MRDKYDIWSKNFSKTVVTLAQRFRQAAVPYV